MTTSIKYRPSDVPLLEKREQQHLIFLRKASDTDDPIVTLHRNKLDFPSYRIASDLVLIGALAQVETERPESQKTGNVKKGYLITGIGGMLLHQLERFVSGQVPDNLSVLLEYWNQFNPARYSQNLFNLSLVDDLGMQDFVSEFVTKNDPVDPIMIAVKDIVTGFGSADIVTDTLVNPHSTNERKGGSFQSRLSGYDAHALAEIVSHTGLEKQTDLVTYLLTIALTVVKKQQQMTEVENG